MKKFELFSKINLSKKCKIYYNKDYTLERLKMQTSCGTLIYNQYNEILMGHSTGNVFWDLPKGGIEIDESEISCALRECKEETGLELDINCMIELGLFSYNRQKNIHLFKYFLKKEEVDLSKLNCSTYFTHHYTKLMVPEFDDFKWVKFDEIELHCAKSMTQLLIKITREVTTL